MSTTGPEADEVRTVESVLADSGARAAGSPVDLLQLRRQVLSAARKAPPDRSGRPLSRALRQAADVMVAAAARSVARCEDGPMAWMAVGNYAAGLVSAGSRLAMRLLHEAREPDPALRAAAAVTKCLADAGLHCSVKVARKGELLDQMRADAAGAVALLSARRVAGNRRLGSEVRAAIRDEFVPACWGAMAEKASAEATRPRDPFTGSPYCTEPNLLEGAGGLRDSATALALAGLLEKLPDAALLLPGPAEAGRLLARTERTALRHAQDVVLRARNRLHLLDGGSDLLHRAAQLDVAAALGYGGPSAASDMMKDLLDQTARVARIVRAVAERVDHACRVGWHRPARLGRRALPGGFVAIAGRIYAAGRPAFPDGPGPLRLMQVFRLSQRLHLPVSQSLLDECAAHLDLVDDACRADPDVGREFLRLLGGSVGVADRLSSMRDCGLLGAYLPEFAALVNRIDPDAAADHTLDEHAVQAVRIIDELAHSGDSADAAERNAVERIGRPDLLRLALLLHDADADAARVGERLGLGRAETELLAFLLGGHHRLVEGPAPAPDESEADALARSAGTPDRLRMAYLMAYAHGRAMGPAGWYAWRNAHLYALYQRAMAQLDPAYEPTTTEGQFRRELRALAARQGLQDDVAALLERVPGFYWREVSPADALAHLAMLRRLDDAPAAMSWNVGPTQATAWVCTSDVPARFAQLAAVFTHNGLAIDGATAFTLRDGTVLDRFVVHRPAGPVDAAPGLTARVEADVEAAVRGETDFAAALRESTAGPAPEGHREVAVVHARPAAHGAFAVLEVIAWDRPGLLFQLADAVGAAGLNIEMARVRTRGDLAQDVFYVTGGGGDGCAAEETRLAQAVKRLREAAQTHGPQGTS